MVEIDEQHQCVEVMFQGRTYDLREQRRSKWQIFVIVVKYDRLPTDCS